MGIIKNKYKSYKVPISNYSLFVNYKGIEMKGIVFTEFMDMVDEVFGVEITEEIIEKSDLPSGGAYTSVGTYPHSEIVSLVTSLGAVTGHPVPDLIRAFGKHMLSRFHGLFPEFFAEVTDVTSFLAQVDNHIHVEVRKLYPDADLPSLETTRLPDGGLEMIYKSNRMMGDLAEGLISGALDHFGNTHICSREDLQQTGGAQCIRFTMTAH